MSDLDSDVPLSQKLSVSKRRKSIDKSKNFESDYSEDISLRGRNTLNKNKKQRKAKDKKVIKKATKGVVAKKKVASKTSKRTKVVRKPTKKNVKSKTNESDIDFSENISGDMHKLFKPGQKYITPPNGDGTRAFYESLYSENPYSLIALRYCVEYGILMGSNHTMALQRLEHLREKGFLKRSGGGIQSDAIQSLQFYDKGLHVKK
ncbi:uncharacterized protein CMU_013450 [Cryptosporidium muris RN66]|uniref:Uncharacterized protein n=1 Tax=Cryptosporidium muris (strain RN66) TaxID=441375 RepID=B6AEQ3_CRYMR|nr:uncharacterized protein CMU_013450 [Cryptosporidium muris RN66]EEA06670.1 hypothetical protein, conserved [Cryptosporidium muris RN66]|eukprot:XP_002141019.1 hypothetical protein [Cryptosporidium muris RN66]